MKIVKEFSNAYGRCTIFEMNNKFIVKIENGNYEQTYKLSSMDYLIQSAADFDVLLDEKFMQSVNERFLEMHQQWMETIQRNDFA